MSVILVKSKKLSKRLPRVMSFALAVLMIGVLIMKPVKAAMSDADYYKFSQNDIYFYAPGKCIKASSVRGDSNGSDVLVIGDSISTPTYAGDEIKSALPNAIIDAVSGSWFAYDARDDLLSGITRLKNNFDALNSRGVLVFAMGTNGQITEANIQELIETVSGKDIQIILMTIYYADHFADSGMESSNAVVRQAAETYENITLMDWYSVASQDPDKYITPDAVHAHPTNEGAVKFAETMKEAVDKVSSIGTPTSNGDGDYSKVLTAKNADEYVFNVSRGSEWYAGWGDGNVEQMTRLLENYGDLAYQLGDAVGAPWVGIIVQMRYEDPGSACGANNFWGNGCPAGTGIGGASIQGQNLGEGFMQYGQTLTNGYHDQALGVSDPIEYLEKIGHSWVYGPYDPDWSKGYGNIEGMRKSVRALLEFIETDEGQAIVAQFGNYHGTTGTSHSSSKVCGKSDDGGGTVQQSDLPIGNPYQTSVEIGCDPRTTDLGIFTGYSNYEPVQYRLCALDKTEYEIVGHQPTGLCTEHGVCTWHAVVNSRVSGAFAALAHRYYEQYGKAISSSNSFRTKKDQEEIQGIYSGQPGRAAGVGDSPHQAGTAIDFNTGCAFGTRPEDCHSGDSDWLGENVGDFGLKRRVDTEPWHVDPGKYEWR